MATEPRHARCKRCKLLFKWPSSKKHLVRYAHCPECGRSLSRTCAALLKSLKPCGRWPIFIGHNRKES